MIYSVILFGLWAMLAIQKQLFFAWLWQTKEYRLDRMMDHFSVRKHWESIIHIFFVSKAALLIVLLFFPSAVAVFKYIFGAILAYEAWFVIEEIRGKGIYRPQKTVKSVIIVAASIVLSLTVAIAVWASFPMFWFLLTMIVFDIFAFDWVSVWVQIANLFSTAAKGMIIRRAQKKLAGHAPMKVIGIAGSYGKSSAKEIIFELLSGTYKVLKTPSNINTDIGIAQVILKDLKDNHEVFVVEMGAYRSGEIRKICDYVKPSIGILTALGDQHLSLFGGEEKMVKAKLELFDSLPDDGISIVNLDSELIVKHFKELKGKVQTYGINYENADMRATDIVEKKDGISCQISSKRGKIALSLPFMGKHSLYAVLAGVATANALQISTDDIEKRLKNARLPSHTMKKMVIGRAEVIDDTYNISPAAAMAALEFLSTAYADSKKIVFLSPMLELGALSQKKHQEIGKKASEVADLIIFCHDDFVDDYIAGMRQNPRFDQQKMLLLTDPKKTAESISHFFDDEKNILLFEGRHAGMVLQLAQKKIQSVEQIV